MDVAQSVLIIVTGQFSKCQVREEVVDSALSHSLHVTSCLHLYIMRLSQSSVSARQRTALCRGVAGKLTGLVEL